MNILDDKCHMQLELNWIESNFNWIQILKISNILNGIHIQLEKNGMQVGP
jgi:hypothetical protein